MTFEIGQLTLQSPLPPPSGPAHRPARPAEPAEPVLAADVFDAIPASPPPEVLAEVDAAWQRAAELAAQNRELHFTRDERSGRTIIEVRTLDGDVLRTIPPSRMLDVMSGADL